MNYLKRLKALFTYKSTKLKNFEKNIKYTFSNTYYLEKALTHKSIQNKSIGNYERLEFLGDAIIDQTVSVWLFKKYPQSNEGFLTKKRSALVNRDFLAKLGNKIDVLNFVNIEQSVNIQELKVRNNIASDLYESIVGAIFLDGGFNEASNFIYRTLCKSEYLSQSDQNYKGQLIEYCHSNKKSPPLFSTINSEGPEHNKTFIIKVSIGNEESWRGVGSTKKNAEQNGAQKAISNLLGC